MTTQTQPTASNSPFEYHKDWAGMKQEIGQRKQNIAGRRWAYVLGAATVGAFSGAAAGIALLGEGGFLMGAMAGGSLGMTAGDSIASYVMMPEIAQLEIDEKVTESHVQGRNWWSGYREEVVQMGDHDTPTPGNIPFIAGNPAMALAS